MRTIIALLLVFLLQLNSAKSQVDSLSDQELQNQIHKVSLIQWQSSTMIDSLRTQLDRLNTKVAGIQSENDEVLTNLNLSIESIDNQVVGLVSNASKSQDSAFKNNFISRVLFGVLFFVILALILLAAYFIRSIKMSLSNNEVAFQQLLQSHKLELLDRIQQLQHNQHIGIMEIRNESAVIEQGNLEMAKKLKTKLKVIKKEGQSELMRINESIDVIEKKLDKRSKKLKDALKETKKDMNEKIEFQQNVIAGELKILHNHLNKALKMVEKKVEKKSVRANDKSAKKINIKKA